MNDVVNAACIVLPDGTTMWTEPDNEVIASRLRAWREGLGPELRAACEAGEIGGGWVIVRMLREDFERAKGGVA